MAHSDTIAAAIDRITQMEARFDRLQEIYDTLPPEALREPEAQTLLQTLRGYYFDGEWMADYAMDEAGEFPKNMKRGVLSEDGLYHLLCDVMDALDAL